MRTKKYTAWPIRRARIKAGLSIMELAVKAGVSWPACRNVLDGRGSLRSVTRICAALDIDWTPLYAISGDSDDS